jgi:Uncharacterized conserved protein, contains double-stranded beta-helix domain
MNRKLNKVISGILSITVAAMYMNNLTAHPVGEDDHPDPEHAVMLAEIKLGTNGDTGVIRELTGPTETRGVTSIESLGIVELGREFPAMEGRQMRARIFTIEPGGIIGLHTHSQRPGYAYIISGKIIEHRNDTVEPVTHSAGSIAMEKNRYIDTGGKNAFDEPVKALVVDIFTPE